MNKPIDIVLLTCNRMKLTKQSIDALYERLRTPFRLIILDNNSHDGTKEMLQEYEKEGKIQKLILLDKEHATRHVAKTYDMCLEFVESDYFIAMQDDIVIPDLEPDVIQQLIGLMEKYPEHGAIGCRIQRISNVNWQDGDLTPARKALSAYFRIQRKADFIEAGGFGPREWDDVGCVDQMRGKLGKECSWANNLWCNHTGYMVPNVGYPEEHTRGWGWSEAKRTEYLRKPYPKINPKTNIPLPGEKIYR